MFKEEFEELDLSRSLAGVILPKINIEPEEYKRLKVSPDISNEEFLKALIVEGFGKLRATGKIDKSKTKEYSDRVKEELGVFKKLNFIDYVLIVWDVIKFCKRNNIPVGAGRGSAAGSLIFYLIGITGIDSLKYGLYFQRFLSEARAGKTQIIDGNLYLEGSLMADVDLDIDYLRRYEVIEYLAQKYPNKTSKIINLSTLTGKVLIKECGKSVYEKSEHEMNQISSLIPQVFGKVQDIEDVYEKDKEFRGWCDENKEAYTIALKLRDLIKNKSVHASGIAISHDDITETCPVEYSKDGELVSGFDMKNVAEICIKLDVLGLKTLTLVEEICKLVNINRNDIDINDPEIYKYLQNFDNSYGIFQLEAGTAENVTKLIKPDSIEDLSSIMSLARPGAMNFVKQFVENKNRGSYDKIHPLFDPIFENSHGMPIYQEQLLRMLNVIGFTLDEAEICRRIVGKKQREKVLEWEEKIKNKVIENKLPKELGELTWKVLQASADYSFNRCLFSSTIVESESGYKMISDIEMGEKIKAYNVNKKEDHFVEVLNIFNSEKELYEFELEDGRKIAASLNHKFLCSDGKMHKLEDIAKNNMKIITD